MKQEIAIDPVPCARKTDLELLDYVERSIAIDCEERAEIANANLALLRARRIGERADKQAE